MLTAVARTTRHSPCQKLWGYRLRSRPSQAQTIKLCLHVTAAGVLHQHTFGTGAERRTGSLRFAAGALNMRSSSTPWKACFASLPGAALPSEPGGFSAAVPWKEAPEGGLAPVCSWALLGAAGVALLASGLGAVASVLAPAGVGVGGCGADAGSAFTERGADVAAGLHSTGHGQAWRTPACCSPARQLQIEAC